MNGERDELELAETFADIARTLLAAPSLDETLDAIVAAAVATVPGCESAGISLVEGRRISTPASSDHLPPQVDSIQYETGEGPCVDAIREHEVFRTGDLSADPRWPAFADRAAEATGVRSILAVRLFADETTLGALNLYSRAVDAFGRDAGVVAGVLAAHAAVAISNAREVAGLKRAMASRSPIEQAKGIIMASTGCSPEEAFTLLRHQSQALNEKLRDVAADIVARQRRSS